MTNRPVGEEGPEITVGVDPRITKVVSLYAALGSMSCLSSSTSSLAR